MVNVYGSNLHSLMLYECSQYLNKCVNDVIRERELSELLVPEVDRNMPA